MSRFRLVTLGLLSILVFSMLPPSIEATAQPAPCPVGSVLDENLGVCVDPDTGLPVPPEEPVDGEEPVEEEPVEELPQGDLASLVIFHLACNNDFTPDAVRDAGGTGPANGCKTFGTPPFTYTVSANDVPIFNNSIEATERDFARFDVPSPIPAGSLTITIDPVTDYTTEFVSCALSIEDGFTDIVEPSISGGSATLDTLPDQDVECWVYNVNRSEEDPTEKEGGNNEGVVGEPPASTGVPVLMSVVNCPAGTLPTDDLSNCFEPAVGVTFTVANETETLTTGVTDSGGTVDLGQIPTGEWGFIETLPAGFGEPIVFCNGTFNNGPQEAQMEVLFGNQIRMLLFADGGGPEETFVDCTWVNIPASGTDNGPQIFIQTRWCALDVSIPANSSVAEAESLCPREFAGKTFDVDVNGEAIDSDASRQNGQVFFTKLPAPNGGGIYGVTVSLEGQEETRAVFCDNNFGAEEFHTVTTTVTDGNRIDQELYEGQTMRCSWFIAAYPPVNPNITPVPGASNQFLAIEIYNRECPSTVDMTAPSTDLCLQDVTGVTFDITRDGASIGTRTNFGTDGLLRYMEDDMIGEYVFTPERIAGYGSPRFSCEFAHADGVTETSTGILTPDVPGIPISFIGDGSVMCVIYYQQGSSEQSAENDTEGDVEENPDADEADDNGDGGAGDDDQEAPPEDADVAVQNNLTIQFWLCPSGIDPASDQFDLIVNCSSDVEPRNLTMTIDGAVMEQEVTRNMIWEYSSPEIVADIGSDLTTSAWCSSTWIEGGEENAEFPDSVNLDGGTLTLSSAHPATTVYCDWFIFPA